MLRPPQLQDERAFLASVAASRRLHASWVRPPGSSTAYRVYVRRYAAAAARTPDGPRQIGFLASERAGGALVGAFNLSEIIRGNFRNAYLGYCGYAGYARQGLMTEALTLVLREAFAVEKLHRVEANIQPANRPSIALAQRLGFELEGMSPRYLKIGGRWRDHERYALRAETWRALRP